MNTERRGDEPNTTTGTVDPVADLARIEKAHARLADTASRLTTSDMRKRSLLPGWTRGHVLTHVARNADGLCNLLTWARTGTRIPMYASAEARDADISAGATRDAAELVTDLKDAQERLMRAARAVPARRWGVVVEMRGGAQVAAVRLLWLRFREVEIHHVDLGADYRPEHWPPEFTSRAAGDVVSAFAGREGVPAVTLRDTGTGGSWRIGSGAGRYAAVSGPESALLAWLIGRGGGQDLTVEPAGPLPALPPWI